MSIAGINKNMVEYDKISIIIPIYNTAPYLDICLQSVINQTYKNLEIILVNDGSTDNSLEILNKYCNADSRFRLLTHLMNQGPGASRNRALKIASGKYILFVDSDDYIDPILTEKVYYTIKQTDDICIFNASSFENETNKIVKAPYFFMHESFFKGLESYYANIMRIIDVHSPCMKMYNLEFLIKNSIEFPENIYGEDVEFWFKCISNTTKISYCDFQGYKRRIRMDSIMHSGSQKKHY